ncbi:hypothetical protein PCE1_002347 [Barthelona sp. PCE]
MEGLNMISEEDNSRPVQLCVDRSSLYGNCPTIKGVLENICHLPSDEVLSQFCFVYEDQIPSKDDFVVILTQMYHVLQRYRSQITGIEQNVVGNKVTFIAGNLELAKNLALLTQFVVLRYRFFGDEVQIFRSIFEDSEQPFCFCAIGEGIEEEEINQVYPTRGFTLDETPNRDEDDRFLNLALEFFNLVRIEQQYPCLPQRGKAIACVSFIMKCGGMIECMNNLSQFCSYGYLYII